MLTITYEQALGLCIGSGLLAAGIVAAAAVLLHMIERRKETARRSPKPLDLVEHRRLRGDRPAHLAPDPVDVANEAHAEMAEPRPAVALTSWRRRSHR
jgi:hypothetical protein